MQNLFFILRVTWMLRFHYPLYSVSVRVLTHPSVFVSNLPAYAWVVTLTKRLFLSISEILMKSHHVGEDLKQ